MADLRIMLCDRSGVAIQNITTLCENRKLTEVLDQPTQFSFTVNSAEDRIRGLWANDNAPYLDYIRRLVKVYRKEYDPVTEMEQYKLRFAGNIWPLTDSGDEDGQTTSVTAFDPLQWMAHRFVRESDGSTKKVVFGVAGGATVGVDTILRTLVDRTNSFAGPCGLTTTGGIISGVIPQVRVQYSYQMLSQVFQEASSGIDFVCTPLDATNYYVGRLDIYLKRGTDQPNALFGYDEEPHSVLSMDRTFDPTDHANSIVALGTGTSSQQYIAAAADATSQGNYGTLEGFATFSDVVDQNQLNLLAASELLKRRPPQEAVSLKPFPGLEPWRDFNTGDTVRVLAGTSLRGGFTKRSERLFGFTVNWDEEENEDYDVVTSKDEAA